MAANNQGDSHIMTLLRAYGGSLYDETGRFAVNTPEGIRALEWIQNMVAQGITPKGAENLELLDCVNLFYKRTDCHLYEEISRIFGMPGTKD